MKDYIKPEFFVIDLECDDIILSSIYEDRDPDDLG